MDDTEKGCVANIEEGKHSQVFGLHTNAVAPASYKGEQRTEHRWCLGLLLAFGILGSGFQGILTGLGRVLHVILPAPT